VTLSVAALAASPNALARHYSRFRVAERLLLTGHSHQAWPDVAFDGQLEAATDAAERVDGKWERAFARAERVREGFRTLLADPDGEIALGASTHELLIRLLSALPLRTKRRIVTTDGEFHTLRRQLARLEEERFEVVRESAADADSLAERLAARVGDSTLAVFVSAVLYETARVVTGLDRLAAACRRHGVPLVVDVYHALGALPFRLGEQGLDDAFVVGGGYKYLELGEGNGFLRLPPGSALRPVVTGWYAEFPELETGGDPRRLPYPAAAGARFAGSTYDPTSHYRAARVLDFFAEQGLSDRFLREVSRHQVGRLAAGFDALDLPSALVTRLREVPLERVAGFLALRSRRAAELKLALAARGVAADARGEWLRLGPAPYLSDAQLDAALAALGEAARALA
jgi:kynureninase